MNMEQLRDILLYIFVCFSISVTIFILEHLRNICGFKLKQKVNNIRSNNSCSHIGSTIFLLVFLSLVFNGYKDVDNQKNADSHLNIAISGHVIGYSGYNTINRFLVRSIQDYILGISLNSNSFKNCFVANLKFGTFSFLVYKNRDGIVKGSYRGYNKAKRMFIHCSGKFPPYHHFINCEGFQPNDDKLFIKIIDFSMWDLMY